MEAVGDDIALEPDQATTTHIPVSCRMVPPLRRSVKPPSYYLFPMTVELNGVYDDHQYSGSVRKDNATHCAFLVRHLARSPGIVHTYVRVSWVYTVREPQYAIRRAHHSRRDVGSRYTLVRAGSWGVMYLIVFGQGLHIGHSELFPGVLCRAYTDRRRSPVICIVLRHRQSSLQVCCVGEPAC